MNELKDLWWIRAQSSWRDAIKYLRIIVTGYVYLPIIFLLFLGWLYKSLLQWLPPDYPIGWVIAGIFSLLLNYSPMRTFLKKADVVFLLPAESKLVNYFVRSYLYSLAVQSLGITTVLLLLGPLYTLRLSAVAGHIYVVLLAIILLKGWNLYIAWLELRWLDSRQRFVITLLRYIHNVFWSLYLVGIQFGNIGFLMILTLLISIVMKKNSPQGYPWARLIELEEQSESTFYSFAHWFMEIPERSGKIGRRTALLPFIQWIPHNKQSAYTYLYMRSIFRYNDQLYGYLRLVFIGFFILLFVHQFYLSLALSAFFLLLNTIQLANGWHRLKHHFWYHIYPMPPQYRRLGFSQSIGALLFFQMIVLSGAFFYQYPLGTAFFMLLVGIFITFLMIQLLLPRVIKEP